MDGVIDRTSSPHKIYQPSGGLGLPDLVEVWRFRDMLIALAERDVKLRYRQTLIGVAWVVLQPMFNGAIFAFVFGMIAHLPSDGVPYFLFAYAGQLGWTAFNATLSRVSNSLLGNAMLVTRTNFPRIILPLSATSSVAIDFLVALAVLLVLMTMRGLTPWIGLVLLPVWAVLIIALAFGIGLFAAALSVRFRDVQNFVPVATSILQYASPVAYSLSALDQLPATFRRFYMLNPLVGPLEAIRWSLFGTNPFPWGAVAYSTGVTLVVLVAGAIIFRKMERTFADVI